LSRRNAPTHSTFYNVRNVIYYKVERVGARDANKPNASSERVKFRVRGAITFSGIYYSVQELLQSQLIV